MKSVIFFLEQQAAVLQDIYRQTVINEERLDTVTQVKAQAELLREMLECREAIEILRRSNDSENHTYAAIPVEERVWAELVA